MLYVGQPFVSGIVHTGSKMLRVMITSLPIIALLTVILWLTGCLANWDTIWHGFSHCWEIGVIDERSNSEYPGLNAYMAIGSNIGILLSFLAFAIFVFLCIGSAGFLWAATEKLKLFGKRTNK